MQIDETKYPCVLRFSKSRGIPPENLIEAFEIEKEFHNNILNESDPANRKELYKNLYQTVHKLYGKKSAELTDENNPKNRIVKLFQKELDEKSILDVGCGSGAFLLSVSKQLKHKKLIGIDVSTPVLPEKSGAINFFESDVVEFDINEKVDVAFSDNVLEHIAPSDIPIHLSSIKNALNDGGIFIIIMPNRLFGPSDVTRIIDDSGRNRIPAQGSHLNESTYSEMVPTLKENGFYNFKTILSLPKLVDVFRNVRINPSLLMLIEKSKLLLNLVYMLKRMNLAVVLICQKK